VGKTKGKKNTTAKGAETKTSPHGETLLFWSVSPLRQNPKKTRYFLLSVLAFLSFIYLIYGQMLWVAFGVTAITISFHSFLFPSDYRFTTLGVVIRTGLFTFYRPWGEFKSVLRFQDGIMLDYAHKGVRRFLVPGQFIYYGADNRQAVINLVEKHMQKAVENS